MNKLVVALLTSTLLVCCSSSFAQDIPVYAEVSSVDELRSAVSKLRPMTGGAIYIKAGEYAIGEPIVIKGSSHVSFLGDGIGKTVIRKKGDGDALVFTGPCNSCSVRNISIIGDPNAKSGSGIVFSDTDWSGLSTMDSCRIEGFPENGVFFSGRDATPQSSSTVSDCIIANNRKAQIYSHANNDYYFVRNHLIVDSPSARDAVGIYLKYSSAGTISYNYISKCRIAVQLDKGSSMNRLEYNTINDCTESAFDSGMVTPAAYDVSVVPREQLYVGWEWSVSRKVKMNTEDMFCRNTIYASGRNPGFIAFNARSTEFATVNNNKISAGGRIRGIVSTDRNCMFWIITGNTYPDAVIQPFTTSSSKNVIINRNTVAGEATLAMSAPKHRVSLLSGKLLKVLADKRKPGEKWFRAVSSADELEKAIREIPATGGTIYIQAGIYRVKSPIVIQDKSNLTLIGSGLGTFLRGTGDSDLLVFQGKCSGIYIGNMNLSPDKGTPWAPPDQKLGSGILFKAEGRGLTVDYCIIDNWPVSCIRIEGKPESKVEDVVITGNWIIKGKQAQLYMSNCRNFNVSDNQFGYPWPDKSPVGAYLERCSYGLYELNYHWGNKIGFWIAQDCSDIRILENRAEQSKENGLLLGMPEGGLPNRNILIEGNTFHTNPELDPGTTSNVAAYKTSNVTFAANQVYTWRDQRKSSNGIELDEFCRDWLFDSNYVRDFLGEAIKYPKKNGIAFRNNIYDQKQSIEIQPGG